MPRNEIVRRARIARNRNPVPVMLLSKKVCVLRQRLQGSRANDDQGGSLAELGVFYGPSISVPKNMIAGNTNGGRTLSTMRYHR